VRGVGAVETVSVPIGRESIVVVAALPELAQFCRAEWKRDRDF